MISLSPPFEPLESTLTRIDTFCSFSDQDAVELTKPITVEEIKYDIKMASPNKVPGPNEKDHVCDAV